MVAKLIVLVAVTVHTILAAPQPFLQMNIDNLVNGFFGDLSNTITPDHPLEIRANQPNVAEIYIQMTDVSITGVNNFASYGSSMQLADVDAVSIIIKSPKVTLDAGHYFINGTMVDHIQLVGEGPGMISVDDMEIRVNGRGNFTLKPVTMVFSEASINLEMWRWTVNLEDLMPGTDLGTVFNEFFTMCGPEIFDTIENNLNSSGKLLNFLNSLFSPKNPQGSHA